MSQNYETMLQFLTTLYILIPIKSDTKCIILWKVTITFIKFKIWFYLSIFLRKTKKSQVVCMVTKMYIALMLHPI